MLVCASSVTIIFCEDVNSNGKTALALLQDPLFSCMLYIL